MKDLQAISTFTYGYDEVGNRTSKNVGDHLENYGYDDLDRLTSVSRTGVGENTWRFGYDAVGNRTSTQVGSGEVVSPTFNNRNQLQQQAVGGALVVEGTLDEEAAVSVNGAPARMVTPTHFEATIQSNPGTNAFTVAATDPSGNVRTDDYEVAVSGTASSYGYDAAGNLISKTLPGETWTYTWNALNQLTSASRNGALQASFQYDPLGRRVVKSTPVKVTTYTYDGADILRENVTAGGITTTSYYVHGPSIDEPLAKETGGVMTYYHADGLGSIVKETSALGAVTNTLRYDAWGNIEAGARDGFAFTGREWDLETGLYYYRARYYDPKAGRFISEDPIGFGGGTNFFAYVGNRVANSADPLGLMDPLTHYGLTFVAARACGLSLARAHELGLAAAEVDARPHEQEAGAGTEHHHAMRNPKDTAQEASDKMEAYIRDSWQQGDVAAVLHVVQDSMANGHSGFQPYTGRLALFMEPTWRHIRGDFFPDPYRLSEALWRSVDVIRDYLRSRGEKGCECNK